MRSVDPSEYILKAGVVALLDSLTVSEQALLRLVGEGLFDYKRLPIAKSLMEKKLILRANTTPTPGRKGSKVYTTTPMGATILLELYSRTPPPLPRFNLGPD